MENNSSGRILKGIGGFYYVDTEQGLITCRARGKLRKLGETPYIGDFVSVSVQSDKTGYIMEIHERKNFMIRPPIANIDMIAIIASKAPPCTDTYFIDRITAMAAHKNIEVCIVINKCDQDIGNELFEVYQNTRTKVFRLSAISGEGVSEFKKYLSGKLTAFTGNSGVGKSTLINALLPSVSLETGEINKKIGRGRHTTRLVEILKADEKTWIADTPGFSAFDISMMAEIEPGELELLFPEFSLYSDKCRYIGCSHLKEEDCAVIEAVSVGEIERSRHESYAKLYAELDAIPKYKKGDNR